MPQVLRPRQPEAPKQPEAPRQPERPKPPEMPRQPERPKPPEPPKPPKPETVKRPDPPKPPAAPKQTPKTPEKQNSSRSPAVEMWEVLWEDMSTFARILFIVGLFGVIVYGVKLALVLVGAREMEHDVVRIWIPFLDLRPPEIPLSMPVYFVSFLVMVMKLALVCLLDGPRGAMDEFAPFLLRAGYWVFRAVVLWCGIHVSCAAMSGQGGGIFELGALACAGFQLICIFGPTYF